MSLKTKTDPHFITTNHLDVPLNLVLLLNVQKFSCHFRHSYLQLYCCCWDESCSMSTEFQMRKFKLLLSVFLNPLILNYQTWTFRKCLSSCTCAQKKPHNHSMNFLSDIHILTHEAPKQKRIQVSR